MWQGMKKRNKAEVLSGQRIKIAALLMGISLLLLSGCGNKAQEAEGSQVQTDIAVIATEQTAAAEEQAETTDIGLCIPAAYHDQSRIQVISG